MAGQCRTRSSVGLLGSDRTLRAVDVRIGVTQAPREVNLEVDDGEKEATESAVEAALSGESEVLWLTDRRGRRVAVPAAKIAYVELGTVDDGHRIGFGS
jgi:Protein of unknown function (DUF3107)